MQFFALILTLVLAAPRPGIDFNECPAGQWVTGSHHFGYCCLVPIDQDPECTADNQ